MRHTPGKRILVSKAVSRGDPRFKELADQVGSANGFLARMKVLTSFTKASETSWIKFGAVLVFFGALIVTLPFWLKFLLNLLPTWLLTSTVANTILNFFMPARNAVGHASSPFDFLANLFTR